MLKAILMFVLFAIAVLTGWAIHPVLGVVVAVVGYGVIDGVLTR